MDSESQHPETPHVQRLVRADALEQVEPSYGAEFVPHPMSLTSAELGGLPATLASDPTTVRAWVRYPAISRHVHGLALAWTPRAVYVEWEDSGTHRAWVWAPAVERAAPSQPTAPPQRPVDMLSAREVEPLVELVKVKVARAGAEFVTSAAQPPGPSPWSCSGPSKTTPCAWNSPPTRPGIRAWCSCSTCARRWCLANGSRVPSFPRP